MDLVNEFERLLDRAVTLSDNPVVTNRKSTSENGDTNQVARYMELMARISDLTDAERQEFHDLMEIVGVDEELETYNLRYDGKVVASARTRQELKEKMIVWAKALRLPVVKGRTANRMTVSNQEFAFSNKRELLAKLAAMTF